MNLSLKIEIPVHAEEGWTCKSPDELPVRARLEASASRSPKSPETLKKAEDYARMLRQAHIESVQARAARESQLVQEAKARRLRVEASSRQRLQDRLDLVAQREARISAEKTKAMAERMAKREMLEEAVKEARQAREMARMQRAAIELSRCDAASSKRDRVIQATVDKNAFQVKHALAVSTAVREMEREAAAAAEEKINLKLESAVERRQAAFHSPREEASERATERAKQVAEQRHEMLVKTEEKRRHLARAMERAEEKRDAIVATVVAHAATSNSKAADTVASSKQAASAGKCSARRALFGKLNEAEVRRNFGKKQTGKKVAEVIEVQVHPDVLPAPPAELVKRLEGPARKEGAELAASLATRHAAAALRASAARSRLVRKAVRFNKRVAHAAAKRSATFTEMRAKIERRVVEASHLVANHRRSRVAFAVKAAARVKAAAVRRSAARATLKRAAQRAQLKRDVAAGKRAAALLDISRGTHRGAAAAARRASDDFVRVQRAAVHSAALSRAASTRASALLAKSSKAYLRTLPNTAPAKLTKEGGVLLKSEPATPEPAAPKEQPVEQPVEEEWHVVNADVGGEQ